MAGEGLETRLKTRTTRRAIVETGTKLAYAAPNRRSNHKFSSRAAGAISSESCGTGSTCVATNSGSCAGGCLCVLDADGGCLRRERLSRARNRGMLVGRIDCEAGEVCTEDTCYGTVCLPGCGGREGRGRWRAIFSAGKPALATGWAQQSAR